MLFKSTKDWHQNQELSHLLFLGQKFDELFFDYTLDIYMNSHQNSRHT